MKGCKMKLYLVQHGKALSKEADPQRPLSEEGIREVKKMAEFIIVFLKLIQI